MTAIIPPVSYPVVFTDKHGTETTVVTNDGDNWRMTLRGIEFIGVDFVAFKPVYEFRDFNPASFDVDPKYGNLCDFILDLEIFMPVVHGANTKLAILQIQSEIGRRNELGRIDPVTVAGKLIIDDKMVERSSMKGGFEEILQVLQIALPSDTYMKACINCSFSDYSVYGHGYFGGMLCFRHQKSKYLAVQNKEEYMDVMDAHDLTEMVIETYLCPEFERRTPGTGYRG